MTAATVKAAGLALRYPSGWTVLSYTGLSKAQKKAVAKANPKLSVQAQTDADSANVKNTKFYAQDLVAEQAGQYASSLSVEIVGQTDFPSSLSDFKQQIESGYKQIGAKISGVSTRSIGGKTSYEAIIDAHLHMPNGSPIDARLGQLAVPHGDGIAVINVTAPNDATGTALIHAVMESVHKA
jgi:hypothetical protein